MTSIFYHPHEQHLGIFEYDRSIPIYPVEGTRKSNIKRSLSPYRPAISEGERSLVKDLKDLCAQPNYCQSIENLRQKMDIFAATSSICKNVEDYSIISQKGDMLIDEVSVYAMRDTIQWWTHWHGSLKDHCWKHIYTAFSTVVEDISIPPHHLMNGQFRLLGNSLADLLEGLRKEGVGPQNVAFMEMCLLRQYLVQYYVKQDQELRDKLCIHSAFAENWRHILTNTYGVTMSVLMAKQTEATGLADIAVKITPIVDAISMDLIKGESAASPDFAVAFEDNRHYPRHDLLEVYTRYMTLLGLHPSAPLLSRSVSSGLHFVPMMDGARERIKHVRFPMSVSLRHMIESYVKA